MAFLGGAGTLAQIGAATGLMGTLGKKQGGSGRTGSQRTAAWRLGELANDYDPAAETAASVGYAQDVANQTLETSLRNMRSLYGGSNPGGDTSFNIDAQRTADDALDPLKSFAANQKAGETMRKAQLLSMVLGQPGRTADNYFSQASGAGGSAALLAQSLQNLFGQNQAVQDQSISNSGSNNTSGSSQSQAGPNTGWMNQNWGFHR